MRFQAITIPLWISRFPNLQHRIEEPELLDAPGQDPRLLRDNLRDIRRVNRLSGGSAAVMRHLPGLFRSLPGTRPTTILDLATGSADIPLAIAKWARNAGRKVDIVASDISEDILDVARDNAAANASLAFVAYDARTVPLPDSSFDIVLCSLALHHFPPNEAIAVLQEMNRLAASGFIVNDLRRSRAGYLAAMAASRVATRNSLTRHDAPLSVKRAYTPAELLWLIHQAGIPDVQVFTAPWFRMVAVRDKHL